MVLAIQVLQSDIQALSADIGFEITPDQDGNVALQMDGGPTVTLAASITSPLYSIHATVLDEAEIDDVGIFRHALGLNANLTLDGAGSLGYSEMGDGIVYSWVASCEGPRASLLNELMRFTTRAIELRANLARFSGSPDQFSDFSRELKGSDTLASFE